MDYRLFEKVVLKVFCATSFTQLLASCDANRVHVFGGFPSKPIDPPRTTLLFQTNQLNSPKRYFIRKITNNLIKKLFSIARDETRY